MPFPNDSIRDIHSAILRKPIYLSIRSIAQSGGGNLLNSNNLIRCVFLLSVLVCAVTSAIASHSDIHTVRSTYTFYGDPHHSPLQCREAALQGARYEALRQEFGTISTQSVTRQDLNVSGKESTYFDILSETEVKGEWISDIEPPVYETLSSTDGCIIVRCTVVGKARAISNNPVDFAATALRNGTDMRNASTEFVSGDDLFLHIRTPVDGYATVYLADSDNNVYCLLPYLGTAEGAAQLRRGHDYVLFSSACAEGSLGTPDEFTLTASQPFERNRIYVIFSPDRFDRATDNYAGELLPRRLSYADFSKWLLKIRRRDERMGVKIINLDIRESD